ncbi:MAG: anaerobic ribonucleoside-triphosphate reductase [Armatimonadota bacterium]
MDEREHQSTTADIELDESERTRCEIWTRVMGYYRPVSMWNAGKQSEYADRRAFLEPPSAYHSPSGQKKLGL